MIYPTQRTTFTAARLADPHRPSYTGPPIPQDEWTTEIACQRSVLNGYTVLQYAIPSCGTVTHMMPSLEMNARHMDADWLLEQYQEANLPFKRYVMQTRMIPLNLLVL
jgi:hypothetical protein